jgi:hypothetical protein
MYFFLLFSFSQFEQITLYRRNKFKPIDQEPLKDFHENELKNDTETLSVKDDHHDSNN